MSGRFAERVAVCTRRRLARIKPSQRKSSQKKPAKGTEQRDFHVVGKTIREIELPQWLNKFAQPLGHLYSSKSNKSCIVTW